MSSPRLSQAEVVDVRLQVAAPPITVHRVVPEAMQPPPARAALGSGVADGPVTGETALQVPLLSCFLRQCSRLTRLSHHAPLRGSRHLLKRLGVPLSLVSWHSFVNCVSRHDATSEQLCRQLPPPLIICAVCDRHAQPRGPQLARRRRRPGVQSGAWRRRRRSRRQPCAEVVSTLGTSSF